MFDWFSALNPVTQALLGGLSTWAITSGGAAPVGEIGAAVDYVNGLEFAGRIRHITAQASGTGGSASSARGHDIGGLIRGIDRSSRTG